MTRLPRFIFFLVLCIFFNVNSEEDTFKTKTLRAGVVSYDFLPYHKVDDLGGFSGTLNAFLNDISRRENIEISYTVYDKLSDMLSALKNKEIDLVAGLHKTEHRSQYFDFTTPIITAPQGILTNSKIRTLDYNKINTYRWVCVKNTTFCDYLKKQRIETIIKIDSRSKAIDILSSSAADAFLDDFSTLYYLQDEHNLNNVRLISPFWLNNMDFGIAVAKGDRELLSFLNHALAKIPDDIKESYTSLGGDDYSAAVAFSQFKVDLAEAPEFFINDPIITYAYAGDIYPLVSGNDSGIAGGLIPDLFSLISQRSGIDFHFIPTRSTTDLKTLSRSGKVDLIPLANLDSHDESLILKLPDIFAMNFVGVTKKQQNLDEYKTIGFYSGLPIDNNKLGTQFNGKFIGYDTMHSLFTALKNNDIDALVTPKAIAYTMMTNQYPGDFTLANALNFSQPSYCLFSEQSLALKDLIENLLKTVTPQELKQLRLSYSHLNNKSDHTLLFRFGLIFSVIILLISIVIWVWRISVKNEIHKRRLAEKNALDKLNFVQNLIDDIPTMIVLHDANHKPIMWNQSYENAFKTIFRVGVSELEAPLPEKIMNINNTVWETGKPFSDEIALVDDSGDVKRLFYTKKLTNNLDGKPAELLTVITDITEVIKLKETANIAQRLLKSITDAMPGGVLQYILPNKENGHFSYLSKGAMKLFGLSDKLFDEMRFEISDIVSNDLDLLVREFEEASIELTDIDTTFRVNIKGQVHWCRIIAKIDSEISDKDTAINWNGLVLDITDFKKNERALKEANIIAEQAVKARSNFLATMSHELRTPISGMAGLLELIKDSALNDEQHFLLSNVETSLNNLLFLVNDILDFSKIEAGQLTLEYNQVDLDEVLGGVFRVHAASAESKGIKVELHWQPTTLNSCFVDALRISQVVSNLLNNAVKFTEIGKVVILVNLTSRFLEIKILDTGVGMSEQQTKKLFTPFEQGDSSVARRFGGTGLGMTITKQLLDAMHGSIEVESQIGVGTKVSIIIPVKECKPTSFDVLKQWSLFGCPKYVHEQLGLWKIPIKICESSSLISSLEDDSKVVMVSLQELINELGTDWQRKVQTYKSSIVVLNSSQSRVFERISPNLLLLSNDPLYPDILRHSVGSIDGKNIPNSISHKSIASFDLDINLLVVEDNKVNQLLLTRQLEKLGTKFSIVNNGVEAVNMWPTQDFDLVLTDCHMPFMDGYQLTQKLRSDKFHVTKPIIGITADDSKKASEAALQAGMNGVLLKPYTLEQLYLKLEKHLGNKIVTSKIEDVNSFNELEEEASLLNSTVDSVVTHWGVLFKSQDDAKVMATVFIESIESDIERLNSYLKEDKQAEMSKMLHTIKGAVSMVYLNDLVNLIKVIENTLLEGSSSEATTLTLQLIDDLEKVIVNLKAEFYD